MGSEMCIRDSFGLEDVGPDCRRCLSRVGKDASRDIHGGEPRCRACLLYTSDAADERSSVDLGGRRIIKKKNDLPLGSQPQRNHYELNTRPLAQSMRTASTGELAFRC